MRPLRAIARRLLDGKIALLAASAALVAAPASGDVPDDGAPSGTFAFFAGATACPAGWKPTSYGGRLVVGTTTSDYVGVTVGAPLGDREDRAHHHAWSATAHLPYKSISAADGSSNNGAAAMDYPLGGETDPGPSGLPFIQLLACEKP